MNKQEVYDFLDKKGVWHEITEHSAVFSMDELCDVELPHPEADAKIFCPRRQREIIILLPFAETNVSI